MRYLLWTIAFSWCLAAAAQASEDNVKLTELYKVDQSSRQNGPIDWAKLNHEDEARRVEVHRMLDAGEVRTGTDYYHAAMVYQHGQTPDEYLLAHVLAMDAVARGSNEAKWLSAATLDRYLRAIWQPQVFGTQFQSRNGQQMEHETMYPSLASDSMRAALCVVGADEQKAILNEVHQGKEFRSSHLKDCK